MIWSLYVQIFLDFVQVHWFLIIYFYIYSAIALIIIFFDIVSGYLCQICCNLRFFFDSLQFLKINPLNLRYQEFQLLLPLIFSTNFDLMIDL